MPCSGAHCFELTEVNGECVDTSAVVTPSAHSAAVTTFAWLKKVEGMTGPGHGHGRDQVNGRDHGGKPAKRKTLQGDSVTPTTSASACGDEMPTIRKKAVVPPMPLPLNQLNGFWPPWGTKITPSAARRMSPAASIAYQLDCTARNGRPGRSNTASLSTDRGWTMALRLA